MFIVLLALLAQATAAPLDRLTVEWNAARGLGIGGAGQVVQDDANLLYISTKLGVMRFDGQRWVRIGGEGMDLHMWELAPASDGVWALQRDGTLWRMRESTAEHVPMSDDMAQARDIATTTDGRLLITTQAGALWIQERSGWRRMLADHLVNNEKIWHVRNHEGYVSAISNRGAFRVVGSEAQRMVTLPSSKSLIDAVFEPDGTTWLQQWIGPLDRYAADGRKVEEGVHIHQRATSMVKRDDLLIAAFSGHLAVRRPDGSWERHTVGYGGDLWLDHERSLWMSSPGGLLQIPEFGTRIFDRNHGLLNHHARYVLDNPTGVWASTWGGAWHISSEGTRVQAPATQLTIRDPVCTGGDGRSWGRGVDEGSSERTVYQMQIAPDMSVSDRPQPSTFGCAVDAEGSVWLGVSGDWQHVRMHEQPTSVAIPPLDQANVLSVDEKGQLWATTGEDYCYAPTEQVVTGEATWSCGSISGARVIEDVLAVPNGDVWIASDSGGLHRLHDGIIEPVPGARAVLQTQSIHAIATSPRGGVWVGGGMPPVRLATDTLQVLERLSQWQGLPITSSSDILEDHNGTVWLATSRGVVRVPSTARTHLDYPPDVRISAVRVDGQARDASRPVHVPAQAALVELDFAALSFRDPGRVRYRVSMKPGGVQELDIPRLRLFDLPSGPVHIQMQASLDGHSWTAAPAQVLLQVGKPWWQHPLTWLVVLAFVVGALIIAYRTRVSFLLSQERQRLRIAMDLHDELGSGLGSVGLLAGVLTSPDLPDEDRSALAQRVTDIAAELGGSLHDIVWSLRPGGDSLPSLMDRLRVRGHDLFHEQDTQFDLRAPDPVPPLRLSLPVRRNLERMCQEALHNAAKYSQASSVVIGLSVAGPRPELWVSDDGRGFDPQAASAGLGLESLRRRAQRIGAQLVIESQPGSGTTIHITFDPLAADRRESTP